TVIMDVLAVLLALVISSVTAACIFIYIIFSRLYSYKKIRLKQYAVLGYLVVILNQGGLIFFTVFQAANKDANALVPLIGVIYSTVWFLQVKKNSSYADFKHTMRMNKIASACTNLAFITLLILNQLD